MTRRELLTAVVVAAPLGATVNLEAELMPTDLVVVQCTDFLTQESRERIKTQLDRVFDGYVRRPQVIILDRSMTLRVERGVAKLE